LGRVGDDGAVARVERGEEPGMKQAHTLVVQVEDHPGVLNRVVSLLRRRSFNINSITVGHSEQPGVSRMTIVVEGEDEEVEQVGKQLYKLMEVLKVTDVTDLQCVAHELALIKVAAKAQHRSEILQIAQIFEARVVDASPSSLLLEATGPEDRIDSLLTMLRGFGIRELVRTGAIAMVRGSVPVGKSGRLERDREAAMPIATNGVVALAN
jgi:acetolactate synthase-1/3 small subunit